jgi:hypothetical protein
MAESSEPEASASQSGVAPVLVVIEGVSAGFGVRDGGRLRFTALHPRFEILDGSRFARPEQLRSAARRVAEASRERKRSG